MDKFLIAPINSGIKTDIVPFMAPEDSFQRLTNMFIYDGKIRRRPAEVLLTSADLWGATSRLKVQVGVTDVVTGNLAPTVIPGNPAIGIQFYVNGTIFTAWQANGAMYATPDVPVGVAGTFNVGTATVTITGAAPGQPVYAFYNQMITGFAIYDAEIQLHFAFDLEFAYLLGPSGYTAIPGGGGLYTTLTTDRFQSENFEGNVSGEPALFITNNRDRIRYFTTTVPTFTDIIPATSAAANFQVRRCVDIIGFQGRLLLLSTVEYEGAMVEVSHFNRIRYSEYGNAFAADSWYQPPAITNKGGFIDLPAGEKIVTGKILDGRLIVFTYNTIYEVVPTGNYREPFQIALIDDTFGSMSPNVVEVNNTLLFANNFGIHIFDGRNVNKISEDLGDDFDDFEYRLGAIYKDSNLEIIYILVASELGNTYGDRIILYNYKNNTFSTIFTTATTLGVHYRAGTGALLAHRRPIIGNHKGYVHYLDEDVYKNALSQNIINVTRFDAQNIDLTIYNHQYSGQGTYIRIENSTLAGLNGSYFIEEVVDDDTVRVKNDTSIVGNYLGDGTVALIDNINVTTKQFNPYMKQGFGTSINKVVFNVNKTTDNGIYTVIGLPNNTTVEATVVAGYLGERQLETAAYALVPMEAEQDRVWHSVYTQTTAESVSLVILLYPDELLDDTAPYQDFTINAIILYTEPSKTF